MDIRILNYIVIILLGVIFMSASNVNNKNTYRKLYVILICILLGIQSAFRHLVTGPDTLTYYDEFNRMIFTSWGEIFENFYLTYIMFIVRDPGYPLFIKIFQQFSQNWQLFLSLIAVFYFWALYDFIYKNTTNIIDVMFALVLYVALFQIVGLSPIRQQIAIGFALFSLNYIKEKQHLKFFLLVLIGSQFHITLLFIVIFWIMTFMPKNAFKPIYIAAIFISPVIFIFARDVVVFMAELSGFYYFMGYARSEGLGGAIFYIIICMIVALFGLINLGAITKSSIGRLYSSAIALMVLSVQLMYIDGGLIRISWYYSFYMMAFIPYNINFMNLKSLTKAYLKYIAIILLVIMSLTSHFEYYFFWQSGN